MLHSEAVFYFQPMSLERNSFRDRREGYTDKAVVIRFFFYIDITL